MITLQNTVVVVGGWIGVSFAAAVIWGLVAKAIDDGASQHTDRAESSRHAALTTVTNRAAAHDPELDAAIADALDGSPWAELGPLQDRLAGRRRAGTPDTFRSAR